MRSVGKAKVTLEEEHYHSRGGMSYPKKKVKLSGQVEFKVPDGIDPNHCLAFFYQRGELERSGDEWRLPVTSRRSKNSRCRWKLRTRHRSQGYGSIFFTAQQEASADTSEWFSILRQEAQDLRELWNDQGQEAVNFAELMGG